MEARKEGSSAKVAARRPGLWAIAIALVAVAAVSLLAVNYSGLLNPTGLAAAQSQTGLATAALETGEKESQGTAGSSSEVSPMEYAVRQRYFEEVFKPNRDEYNLFEKAAAYLNKPVGDVPGYFSLNSEEEVFADLPTPAGDFSEIAYLLANGKYFSIGYLEEEYYKQPEFYPYFKELGLRYWTKPDPKYWTPHGYGSYPAEQWTTLTKGENEEFTAVVFFYTGWGVQTFQGVTLMPDSQSQKYFDIKITPQNFLLEPSFPKFYKNWAYKVAVEGKLKPDTPPGTYAIGINVERPPADLMSKWEFEYKNIYFDAVASGIAPSGNQIQLNIVVE